MVWKRFVVAILALVMVVTLFAFSAFATNYKPYKSYSTRIYNMGTVDVAVSTIVKCDCNPVDNYLMAGIQVQYKEGNNYYWTPSSTSYYYSSGTNVEREIRSIKKKDITFARGWFQARCGTGSMKSYHATDTD